MSKFIYALCALTLIISVSSCAGGGGSAALGVDLKGKKIAQIPAS